LDPQTGKIISGKEQIAKPSEELVKAMTDVRAGNFQPERENDELTHALGNPEHPG
jgi:nitrogen fixation/metabolism regulation signal transduction histidine kinase